jgi:alpha-D-ribose 1-methylphosphonate 5-triphosphate synthase subunit PhnI
VKKLSFDGVVGLAHVQDLNLLQSYVSAAAAEERLARAADAAVAETPSDVNFTPDSSPFKRSYQMKEYVRMDDVFNLDALLGISTPAKGKAAAAAPEPPSGSFLLTFVLPEFLSCAQITRIKVAEVERMLLRNWTCC